MRADSVGLFWEDAERLRGKANRVMAPIPESNWRPPTQFPNLSSAKVIAVDVETKDPELLDYGPGWARGVGHIVGVSVAAKDGGRFGKWYFPMRHEVQPELNMDPEHVLNWLRDSLCDPSQPKIGANLQYDIGWLQQEGVDVEGNLIDVQFAEALLSENSPVALEALGQKYLGEGKESPALYDWCSRSYGGPKTGRQRANIYRAPVTMVGPYAESDVDLPIRLWPILYEHLMREGLYDVFDMESRLIRLMIAMRFRGVRVDVGKAEQVRERVIVSIDEHKKTLDRLAGFPMNANSPDDLKKVFDSLRIRYPQTEAGNPSFRKDWLAAVEHPIAKEILEIRKLDKMRSTFIDNYILGANVSGIVYGSFHQLRSDGGGTRSGRFSSSDPNLQNIPARDPIWGPLIRSLYLPDDGHVRWRSYDYSQIEYRGLAHYAVGPGAEELRAAYRGNPKIDYHSKVQELVRQETGMQVQRKPLKNINFGLIYGMSRYKLALSLGLDKKGSDELFTAYHAGAPYVQATMNWAMDIAQRQGYVETIFGRRSRFDLWESNDNRGKATSYYTAAAKYGHSNIKRAGLHKAINRILQGTAAEIMKASMLKCWESGIYDATGVPSLTVHDETDHSDPGGVDEAFIEMKYTLENTVKLRVPIVCDYEAGPNWGDLKSKD